MTRTRANPFVMTVVLATGLSLTAPAAATQWTMDPEQSRIVITATQAGASFEATFEQFEADIVFDPEALDAASVEVRVTLASFNSGTSDRDSSVQNETWFDVANTPVATFRADDFSHLGGDDYEADGALAIRLGEQPVTLPFTLTIDGDTATATGATTIDRTDHGVGTGDFADGDTVGLDVDIAIEVVATR